MALAPDPKQPAKKKAAKAAAAAPKPTDWGAVLGMYGMTPDMVNNIQTIWKKAGGDDAAATPVIMRYVRGTPWYQQQFPGIDKGIQGGLFSDERGYQAYKNDISQLYKQYYRRPATAGEIAQFVQSGQAPSQVANQFESNARQGTLTDPLKNLFTKTELRALTDQASGISTQLGMQITQQANLASQVTGLYTDFFGRAPTRQEIAGYVKSGQSADDVAKQFATQSNINAMNPAVSHLFTPEEIHQIALQRAGGTTANGQQLNDLANLAANLNPVYHQYTGNGVSREDVQAAYTSGESPTQVAQKLSGAGIAKAYGTDFNQALGSFGEGQLSQDQLTTLGQQQAGYDTPAGQMFQRALDRATQAMHGSFRGVLANPALNMVAGTLSANQKRPDTGA